MSSRAPVSSPARVSAGEARGTWWWHWGPALAAMIAIFAASSQHTVAELPGGMSDKSAHFLAYAGLAVLVLRAVSRARWAGVTRTAAGAAWAICAAYGASDEFHQWFVPGRSASILDWIADVTGAAVAIGVLAFVASRRRAV